MWLVPERYQLRLEGWGRRFPRLCRRHRYLDPYRHLHPPLRAQPRAATITGATPAGTATPTGTAATSPRVIAAIEVCTANDNTANTSRPVTIPPLPNRVPGPLNPVLRNLFPRTGFRANHVCLTAHCAIARKRRAGLAVLQPMLVL